MKPAILAYMEERNSELEKTLNHIVVSRMALEKLVDDESQDRWKAMQMRSRLLAQLGDLPNAVVEEWASEFEEFANVNDTTPYNFATFRVARQAELYIESLLKNDKDEQKRARNKDEFFQSLLQWHQAHPGEGAIATKADYLNYLMGLHPTTLKVLLDFVQPNSLDRLAVLASSRLTKAAHALYCPGVDVELDRVITLSGKLNLHMPSIYDGTVIAKRLQDPPDTPYTVVLFFNQKLHEILLDPPEALQSILRLLAIKHTGLWVQVSCLDEVISLERFSALCPVASAITTILPIGLSFSVDQLGLQVRLGIEVQNPAVQRKLKEIADKALQLESVIVTYREVAETQHRFILRDRVDQTVLRIGDMVWTRVSQHPDLLSSVTTLTDKKSPAGKQVVLLHVKVAVRDLRTARGPLLQLLEQLETASKESLGRPDDLEIQIELYQDLITDEEGQVLQKSHIALRRPMRFSK